MKEISDIEIIYHTLEGQYIKAMGKEISLDLDDIDNLYPTDWFSNKNYARKAKILAEAILKKCLISETEEYSDIEEGAKNKEEEER